MATPEYVVSLLGGLESGLRRALTDAFRYVLINLRFGRVAHQQRAENVQAYYLSGRTAVTPGDEFSIAHGLAVAPYVAIPVLDLQTVNQELVPLAVSRAADANRIYLTSSVADAPFTVLVEGPS
jgi:hypothetical protein